MVYYIYIDSVREDVHVRYTKRVSVSEDIEIWVVPRNYELRPCWDGALSIFRLTQSNGIEENEFID